MKSIIIFLVLTGLILITVGYMQNNLQCPPPKIEYRYVPKTFSQEQNTQQPLLSIAGINGMFQNSDPWMQANGAISSNTQFGSDGTTSSDD